MLNTLSTAALEAGTVKTLLVYEANSGPIYAKNKYDEQNLSDCYLYLYLEIIRILFK